MEDELQSLKESGVDVIVSLLEKNEADELGLKQEKKFSEKHDLTFISFPIEDRNIPSSKWDFLELIEKLSVYLSQGKNLGVHCRQSVGRSSLIVLSLLIASGVDINSAIQNVGDARGCVVPETKGQIDWLRSIVPNLEGLAVHS